MGHTDRASGDPSRHGEGAPARAYPRDSSPFRSAPSEPLLHRRIPVSRDLVGWVPRLGRWADVAVHRDAAITPGVVVYRLDDRLFFANASYVKGRIREALRGVPSDAQWLVLDAQAMTHVDTAGMTALIDIVDELGRDGIQVALARTTHRIEEQLADAGVIDAIGPAHAFPTVRTAVDAVTQPAQPAAAPAATSR